MSQSHRKFGNLEGLRGFAALAVIVFHVRLYFLPDSFPEEFSLTLGSIGNYVASGLIDGGLAVYTFWVMSGYAIAVGFFRRSDQERTGYLVAASSKRYFRLMPPVLASTILSFVLLKLGWFHHEEALAALSLTGQSVLGDFWGFNASFAAAVKEGVFDAFVDYDGASSYNRVLWTIGPELLGSYLVYALVGVFRNHPMRWFAYGATFVALVYVRPPLAAFLIGLAYVDYDLNVGTPVPRVLNAVEKALYSWSGLSLILTIGFLMLAAHRFDHSRVSDIADLGASAFITRLSFKNEFFRKVLSSPAGCFFGRISFGVYLTHVLVIASLGSLVPIMFPSLGGGSAIGIILVVSIAGSIFTGWLMYVLVDRHSQKFASRLVSLLEWGASKAMISQGAGTEPAVLSTGTQHWGRAKPVVTECPEKSGSSGPN